MVVHLQSTKDSIGTGSSATIAELAERACTLINFIPDKDVVTTFTKEGVDEITACIAVKLCKGLQKPHGN